MDVYSPPVTRTITVTERQLAILRVALRRHITACIERKDTACGIDARRRALAELNDADALVEQLAALETDVDD